jgi:predicted acyltransferase
MNFKQKGLLIWAVAIALGYWLILLLVPTPGFGAYNLTPEGNLSAFIDQKLLPCSFCCYQYGDNEGILTTIPAIVNILIGVWAGNRLLKSETWQSKIKFFTTIAFIFIIIGIIWSLIYPVNKYLWTGPFVLLTCGISFLALSLFYWLIDIKGYTKWAFPFVVIGMNSITIYVLQGIFDFGIIAKILIHGFYNHIGSFQIPFISYVRFQSNGCCFTFYTNKRYFLRHSSFLIRQNEK